MRDDPAWAGRLVLEQRAVPAAMDRHVRVPRGRPDGTSSSSRLEVAPTPEELAEYVGSYTSDELDVTYSVEFRDGALVFRRPLDEPRTLEPLFRDAFALSDPLLERSPARALFATFVAWPARFERDATGRVTALYISDSPRVRRLRFDRR